MKFKFFWNLFIGDIVEVKCFVLDLGSILKFNCIDLRFYGFKVRVGDVVYIRVLRRKFFFLCLNCLVVYFREKLLNEFCEYLLGNFVKIFGIVIWVKRYCNGFGLVNVIDGNCWVLFKFFKFFGVFVVFGENVIVYGFFMIYWEKLVFEI